ncbi:MAG: hypothetical protein LBK99_26015 [Opitutaceae bacterium]|jgi:hypothetical protein|nr:hypothetical protein [Opitutaceae bacterium]
MENDFPSKTIEWPQKGTKGAKITSCIFLRLLCWYAFNPKGKNLLSEAAKEEHRKQLVGEKCSTCERLLETPDKRPGEKLRFCEWAPTEHTHMVQNRISDCPVAVCHQAPLA